MHNNRTVIASLLVGVIALGAVGIWAAPSGSNYTALGPSTASNMLGAGTNRFTRPETYRKVGNRLNVEGFIKIMENQQLEVWHKEKNASIRIVDKVTGYVWGGLPADKPEDMNSTWSGIGNSLVSIDYFDKKGTEKRISIADKQVEKKYTLQGNVLRYDVKFTLLSLSFSFEMGLKDGGVTFRMIDDSIREDKEYSLAALYFVPFLGSTRADEIDGYMFLPDGPGSLIRFAKPSQYLVSFDKRIYGKDYGIDNLSEVNDLKSTRPNDFATQEPNILMPVFGMVHGVKQNGFLARVEKGAEYASIMAIPSGVLTNYNWASTKFIYRQKYLQPTSKSGAGVQVAQQVRNKFSPEISYYFLHNQDADYIGMAKLYRDQLRKEGELPTEERVDKDIPLQLDVIGADIQKGFLFNSLLPITTPERTREIAEDLTNQGVGNLTLIMKGWQKGGLNGSQLSGFSFENKLGGSKELQQLAKTIKDGQGRFYYYENPATGNEKQMDLRSEGANSLSQSLIKLERDNFGIWFKDTYFVEANLVVKYLLSKVGEYTAHGMGNMALDEAGSRLYAENQRDHVTTRLEAKQKLEQSVGEASKALDTLAIYRPNQYLWKYVDEIFDVPVVNSQYLFETDTVPFMQIVLKGSVDYYAPYANMSFFSRTDILKMIEYGTYPSFLITGLSNYELKHTPVSELYSTRYEDWKQHIVEVYKDVNTALSKVEGKQIADRTVLAQGVVRMDYEGGTSILVNYTVNEYTLDGISIPAQGYIVTEGV